MKKKGLALQQITIAIISLVVLGFAGGVVKLTRDYYIDKVENQSAFRLPGGAEFMPYQKEMTKEEADADSSMLALACATASVALDQEPVSSGQALEHCRDLKPFDEATTKKYGNGGTYGNIGVACYRKGLRPMVLDKDKKYAVEDLLKATLRCWKKFESNDFNNVNCFDVTVPEGVTITESEFYNALKDSGDLGYDISGKGITNLAEYVWKLDGSITSNSRFYMCGDNAGNNQIFFVKGNDRRTYCPYAKELDNLECDVLGFEFMQKISRDERSPLNPLRWVAAHNQPELVGYFEGWPEGKEKFWQVDTLSMVSVGLIVGFAVLDLLPLAGKGAKAAFSRAFKGSASEATKELAGAGVQASFKEFAGELVEGGAEGAIESVAVKGLKELGGEIGGGVVESFAEKTVAQVADASKDALLRGIKETIGEGTEKLAEPLLKQIDDIFVDIVTHPNLFEATTKTLTKKGRRKLLAQLRRQVFDSDDFAELVLEKAMRLGGGDAALETATSTIEHQLKDAVEKTTREAAEQAAFKLTKESAGLLFKKVGAKEALKIIASESGQGISESAAEQAAKKAFRKIGSMAPDAAALAIKQGREFAKELGDEGLEAMSKGMKSALTDLENKMVKDATTSRAKKLIQRVGIVGGIAYLGWSRQAANEIFWPVGINSFGLDKAGTLGTPKEYPIVKEGGSTSAIQKFLVTSKLHKGERFYVASPCKADMTVRKEQCTCSRMPMGYNHYNFNFDGTKPLPAIEAKGIELNFDVLEDDAEMLKIARRFPKIQAKYIPSTKDKDTYIDFYLDPKLREEHGEDWYEKLIASGIKRIAKSCVRQKKVYPGLFRNLDEIKTGEDIVVESDKCDAVQFYMDIVNMPTYADTNQESWFFVDEITGESGPPAMTWELYAPYLKMDNVLKYCFERDFGDAMAESVQTAWQYWSTAEVGVEDIALVATGNPIAASFAAYKVASTADYSAIQANNNRYSRANYKTDCITVDIQRHEKWNNGINYCIDDYPYINKVRWALTSVEVAASIALTVMTGGIAAPIATAVMGMASGFLEEAVARYAKWPAYDTQGIPCDMLPDWVAYTGIGTIAVGAEKVAGLFTGCSPEKVVPIANTGLTDAQLSAFGGPVEE